MSLLCFDLSVNMAVGVQVGKDQSAQAFLGKLDTDPQVGSMIDCVSDFELEQVSTLVTTWPSYCP